MKWVWVSFYLQVLPPAQTIYLFLSYRQDYSNHSPHHVPDGEERKQRSFSHHCATIVSFGTLLLLFCITGCMWSALFRTLPCIAAVWCALFRTLVLPCIAAVWYALFRTLPCIAAVWCALFRTLPCIAAVWCALFRTLPCIAAVWCALFRALVLPCIILLLLCVVCYLELSGLHDLALYYMVCIV